MTQDEIAWLKTLGITVSVSAIVAVLVYFAFRATTVTGIGSAPVSPNAMRVDLRPRTSAEPSPPPDACRLPEGNYDSSDAWQAKSSGCDVKVVTERPYALMECGDIHAGFAVRRRSGVVGGRFVVDCTLNKPN